MNALLLATAIETERRAVEPEQRDQLAVRVGDGDHRGAAAPLELGANGVDRRDDFVRVPRVGCVRIFGSVGVAAPIDPRGDSQGCRSLIQNNTGGHGRRCRAARRASRTALRRAADGASGGSGMGELIQLVVSGIAVGAIYALAALGFTLLWQASGTINFAQGEFVMLPAFAMLFCVAAGRAAVARVPGRPAPPRCWCSAGASSG